MLISDVPGLLLCFLSQGWFKGAFVSVDLSKEHADTSGQVNCVKKKKKRRENFLNILSPSVALGVSQETKAGICQFSTLSFHFQWLSGWKTMFWDSRRYLKTQEAPFPVFRPIPDQSWINILFLVLRQNMVMKNILMPYFLYYYMTFRNTLYFSVSHIILWSD